MEAPGDGLLVLCDCIIGFQLLWLTVFWPIEVFSSNMPGIWEITLVHLAYKAPLLGLDISPQSIVFGSRGARRKAPRPDGRHLMDREGLGENCTCIIQAPVRALIRRAVKRAGPSKKVWCSRLGSNKTRRFQLRCLKNLHETPFYVNRRIFCWIFCSKAMRKGEFFRDENRT